jgi:hypothetical protein
VTYPHFHARYLMIVHMHIVPFVIVLFLLCTACKNTLMIYDSNDNVSSFETRRCEAKL